MKVFLCTFSVCLYIAYIVGLELLLMVAVEHTLLFVLVRRAVLG